MLHSKHPPNNLYFLMTLCFGSLGRAVWDSLLLFHVAAAGLLHVFMVSWQVGQDLAAPEWPHSHIQQLARAFIRGASILSHMAFSYG